MDALMKNRIKLVCRVLSTALADGKISTYEIEFIDPADSRDKFVTCLKIKVGTPEVSQQVSLPFSTRDSWIGSTESLIQDFVDTTCGNVFTDEEEN